MRLACAFDYGYKDHPEKHNPASGLTCLRITKKDAPPSTPSLVDDPEVPSTLCFRVWKCDVYFQPLKGNLIASIVETNE